MRRLCACFTAFLGCFAMVALALVDNEPAEWR